MCEYLDASYVLRVIWSPTQMQTIYYDRLFWTMTHTSLECSIWMFICVYNSCNILQPFHNPVVEVPVPRFIPIHHQPTTLPTKTHIIHPLTPIHLNRLLMLHHTPTNDRPLPVLATTAALAMPPGAAATTAVVIAAAAVPTKPPLLLPEESLFPQVPKGSDPSTDLGSNHIRGRML